MGAIWVRTRIFLARQTSQAAWFRGRCPGMPVGAPVEREAGALSFVSIIDSMAVLRSNKVKVFA